MVGRDEYILGNFNRYSTPANYEWRNVRVNINVTTATNGAVNYIHYMQKENEPYSTVSFPPINYQIIFYGYCGYNYEDAIAIDNILLVSGSASTPLPTGPATTVPSTTTPVVTTQVPSTTTPEPGS